MAIHKALGVTSIALAAALITAPVQADGEGVYVEIGGGLSLPAFLARPVV